MYPSNSLLSRKIKFESTIERRFDNLLSLLFRPIFFRDLQLAKLLFFIFLTFELISSNEIQFLKLSLSILIIFLLSITSFKDSQFLNISEAM